jgi:FAD/FMN-containing dehydrogenase
MADEAAAELRSVLTGRVIGPDETEYDRARTIFYGGFDRRPAAIARVADAADVARVIAYASETGLELAVRSGGHSQAGYSVTEGGVVLDLSEMRALDIDVEGRTAWAEAGLTTAEYTKATGAHGLATGFGDTGSVAVGGLTVGGGFGFLVRKHGLTIDDLLAADVVTADARLLHVDAETEPDLFWAVRGGGGNFGVVTRFKFRLHPVDTIVGGMLFLPGTAEVIEGFMALSQEAPEELSAIANVMAAPPMPFIPEEVHGTLAVMALMAYAGDTEAGEAAMAPFRALATPLADMVRTMRYPEIYELFPEADAEAEYHPVAAGRTMLIDQIDAAAARAIVDHLQASTAPMAVAQLRALGGAMARVPDDATAFGHRSRRFMVNVGAVYEDPADRGMHEAWVDGLADALRQGESGAYVNFVAAEDGAGARLAYPKATRDRLAEIKARYDPANLFRLNLNIPPA